MTSANSNDSTTISAIAGVGEDGFGVGGDVRWHSRGSRTTAKCSPPGERSGVHQFYTPSRIVRRLVDMLAHYKSCIYDPACGTSGMFVQFEKHIQSHAVEALASDA